MSNKDLGPKQLRFIDVWLTVDTFKKLVRNRWESYSVQGNSLITLKNKNKKVKDDIKTWNKDFFGCMNINK